MEVTSTGRPSGTESKKHFRTESGLKGAQDCEVSRAEAGGS